MTAFWIIAATLVCVALLLVIPPLFRRPEVDVSERREQNIDIARERLAALEAEATAGLITESEYQQRCVEIEQTLYNDLAATPETNADKHGVAASRWSAAALIIVVTVLAGSHTEPMLSHINVGAGIDVTIKALAHTIQEIVDYRGEIVFDTSKPDGAADYWRRLPAPDEELGRQRLLLRTEADAPLPEGRVSAQVFDLSEWQGGQDESRYSVFWTIHTRTMAINRIVRPRMNSGSKSSSY